MTESSNERAGPDATAVSGSATPPSASQLFALAVGHHQRGRLVDAERLYRDVLSINPRHAGALHYSGVSALNQGRLQDAVTLIEKSLAVREGDAEAHYHLGLIMGRLQRFEDAATHNRRAISIKPDFLDAHMNLGNALKALGKLDEAAASYQRVVAGNPKLVAARYNLANVYLDKREFEAAVAAFERVLADEPNHLSARQNLGTALLRMGRQDEAIEQFRRVSAARPDFVEAKLGYAVALMEKGKLQEALAILCRVLDQNENPDAKELFVQCVSSLAQFISIPGVEKHLIAALSEPWARPQKLTRFAIAMMRMTGPSAAVWARAIAGTGSLNLSSSDLEAIASDHLLLAILENALTANRVFERILTGARRLLLMIALENGAADEALLGFACALARQCFINEYVFDLTEEELAQARALCERLVAKAPSPLLIAVVASYFPLYEVAGADRLLQVTWPAPIDALLAQQLREPQLERELRDVIPRLTPVDDDVSLKVQQQYEENPYPRWIKIPSSVKGVPLDVFVWREVPVAPFKRTGKAECEVLVAGCGTGQQPLDIAFNMSGAKILAVDLSRASLAHAVRKTRELGVGDIEYAQADILKLGALGRTFDVIAAGGVLHHMADPFAAWRDLASLLRPNGLMMLGFYSDIARRHIVAARAFIVARNFPGTVDGIRRARQAIMALPDGEEAKSVSAWADFYSTSGCRDLLFHVQEQCATIAQLKRVIDEIGFRFLGFKNLSPEVIGRYRARFPQDLTMTDLDNWNVYEVDNPRTFIGMYQFIVQKPGGGLASGKGASAA